MVVEGHNILLFLDDNLSVKFESLNMVSSNWNSSSLKTLTIEDCKYLREALTLLNGLKTLANENFINFVRNLQSLYVIRIKIDEELNEKAIKLFTPDNVFKRKRMLIMLESTSDGVCCFYWFLESMEAFLSLKLFTNGMKETNCLIFAFLKTCIENDHNGDYS